MIKDREPSDAGASPASRDGGKSLHPAEWVHLLGAGLPDPDRLGGKGAALSRLVSLGYRVPVGLVVTGEAFATTLAEMGVSDALQEVDDALAGGADPSGPATRIRAALLEGTIPRRILEPILAATTGLGLWGANTVQAEVIVRSSATAEDSSALSFAGIFESIPIARAEDLDVAIREVWSSLFSARAVAYARERGLPKLPVMAVVVQRFLAAERSGVMFTRFPGPGEPEQILVEHVEGGCEKLVRGEVTPDRLWMRWGQGVPDSLDGPLDAEHARELSTLAATLERDFHGPQDVEWCIHDGKVHILQSRPITAGLPTSALQSERLDAVDLQAILTGVAASPGTGSGDVRLVFNIEQALALSSGQVLVTPMTNPDMVVAMRSSAAIVTDVGGIICHAAIVSRELGLPCVVGTQTATRTLANGQAVTVDGTSGAIYAGFIATERPRRARQAEWEDLWSVWEGATGGSPGLIPLVPSVAALRAAPPNTREVALVADMDLRADEHGLWQDLEGLSDQRRLATVDRLVDRLVAAALERSVGAVYVVRVGTGVEQELAGAVRRRADPRVRMHADDPNAPPLALAPGSTWPEGRAAVPLSSATEVRAVSRPVGPSGRQPGIGGSSQAIAAALDTTKFFGHRPQVHLGGMPEPAAREQWWRHLPEYGRYHREFGTEGERGQFEWLEVRPELVISALLKSLVQPGFEMVPRILGFRGLGPMHVKWIRGRYHFRADSFGRAWEAIVRATWDQAVMADLLRRVRRSYEQLAEVLLLFPESAGGIRALTGGEIVALITSWWPRWVEFFALCWFLQAQGDDIAYPFIEETVSDNLSRVRTPPEGIEWPSTSDLIAPTRPVLSGEYMADVGALRELLVAAGLASADDAVAALDRGEHVEIAGLLERHLRRWHWMRDRDLLFEPWDNPRRVLETALRTEPHVPVAYQDNLRRNLLALGFHVDLAHASGRGEDLARMARFLHDLNVERENHHVLWLKYSYPLRRVFLEVERRLIEAGSLVSGDVFFLQAPELIQAAWNLPEGLPDEVVTRVKNRRLGYLHEAHLAPPGAPAATDEDDYY